MYWRASFNGGDQFVWKVRILNRRDCCGDRLKGVQVFIGNQMCGQITENTRNG